MVPTSVLFRPCPRPNPLSVAHPFEPTEGTVHSGNPHSPSCCIAATPNFFEVRETPQLSYRRSIALLAKYVDQAFSWVDAVVLLSADDDRHVTVDSSLAVYRFSHHVVVSTPEE